MFTSRSNGGTFGDVDRLEQDPALGRQLEAGDHPQGGGLARARRSEHREELAVANLEVDPVDRGDRAAPSVATNLATRRPTTSSPNRLTTPSRRTATPRVCAPGADEPGRSVGIGQAGPLSWVSRRATRSCEWAALCPARLCVSSHDGGGSTWRAGPSRRRPAPLTAAVHRPRRPCGPRPVAPVRDPAAAARSGRRVPAARLATSWRGPGFAATCRGGCAAGDVGDPADRPRPLGRAARGQPDRARLLVRSVDARPRARRDDPAPRRRRRSRDARGGDRRRRRSRPPGRPPRRRPSARRPARRRSCRSRRTSPACASSSTPGERVDLAWTVPATPGPGPAAAGAWLVGCHIPGHWAKGMQIPIRWVAEQHAVTLPGGTLCLPRW